MCTDNVNTNNNVAAPPVLPGTITDQQIRNIIDNLRASNLSNIQRLASRLRQTDRSHPATRATPAHQLYGRSGGTSPSMAELSQWDLASGLQRELSTLSRHLDDVRSYVESTGLQASVINASRQAKDIVGTLNGIVQKMVDDIPLVARPTASSARRAEEVFRVPELLERILSEVDIPSLLPARLVNRPFAEAVARSTPLRQALGWQPAPEGALFSPLAHSIFSSRGVHVSLRDHHQEGVLIHGDEVVVLAHLSVSHMSEETREFPRVSKRFRDTLVCQPPLTEMKVRMSCCSPDPSSLPAHPLHPDPRDQYLSRLSTLSCPSGGLTLGHIIDATNRLRHSHLHCPDAGLGLHRHDGTVDAQVFFEAIVKLNENDPILIARRQEMADFEERVAEDEALEEREDRLVWYVGVKQRARRNGEPVPTMEEALRMRGDDDGDGDGHGHGSTAEGQQD